MRNKNFKQIIVYLAVGAGTALLELLLFELMFELFGLNVIASNIIAVIIATITNFFLNGRVTFQGSSNILRSAVLYMILFIFNLSFTSLAIQQLVAVGVHSAIAKILTQICVTTWNFILYKKVIFK